MKLKFVAKIREERILQLSNDLSEGIQSGTVAEWRAVALYFRKESDELRRIAWNILDDQMSVYLTTSRKLSKGVSKLV